MIVAIMDQCSGEKQQQRGQQQQQHHQQCIAVPGQEDHPDLMACGNHGPSKTSNRRALLSEQRMKVILAPRTCQ